MSISVIKSHKLTDDFCALSVGAICGKRVISHITTSKTKILWFANQLHFPCGFDLELGEILLHKYSIVFGKVFDIETSSQIL